jgi:integrase
VTLAVSSELSARYVAMVMTDIETGLRWGELIALRPMGVDFLRRRVTVHRVIVEASRKFTATGERMVVKPYPKNDEPRTLRISSEVVETLSRQIASLGLSPEQLLFSSTGRADGNPISRNTFRTRVWLPAVPARISRSFP